MGSTGGPEGRRSELADLVRRQAAEHECWARAETVMRAAELRERLAGLGVDTTPDVGAALMAAAMLIAEGSAEFGGDYRDALGDLAAVGLELLEP